MAFPKIMEHPDKNRIVRWLLEGKGVRKVCKMLKEMYPDDKKMWLSTPTIQAFRKEHLKLEGDALDDIKKTKRQHLHERELQKEHTQVKNLPTYKQKLQEIVDLHLDIKHGLVGMEKLITARLEDLFDAAQRGDITIEKEKLLQGYFDRYFIMIDKWAKYIDKVADFKVEANINVTVVQEQVAILRQTIHELLQEMDPEIAISFLDRLNNRMKNLTYRPHMPPSNLALTGMKQQIEALPDVEIIGDQDVD